MAIVPLTTFFATIGPVDVVAVFAALTARADAPARRSMAVRGVCIAAVILLAFALAGGDLMLQLIVVGCLLALLLATLVGLLLASQVQKLVGLTAMHVISRIFGVLLPALAVQFVFDGIAQSGLITG